MRQYRLPADDLEYSILSLLWQLGTASVRDLHEQLGAPAGRVYTTTAKVVDRLREKGLVSRSHEAGGYIYSAAVNRQDVERARARQLMTRFLSSAPHAAVAALVDAVSEIDSTLLDEIEYAIQKKRNPKDGS